MAFMLITGKPGSYKTAYALDYMLTEKNKGRPCYICNVRGLKDQSFNVLEKFEDWVNCPDGSVILIDEIQEFTRLVPTNAKTEELPSYFTLLEKHRHRGIDFIVTTQHPVFVHTHIRRLAEAHIHFVRRKGLPFAVKKEWSETVSDPENPKNSAKNSGVISTTYRPNKQVFDIYESTVLDSHKFKFDRIYLIKLLPVVIVLLGFLYLAPKAYNRLVSYSTGQSYDTEKESKPITSTSNQPPTTSPTASLSSVQVTEEDNQCFLKWGISPEACAELRIKGIPIYDPNNPYAYQPIPQAKPNDFPRVSGCVKWDGKYYAISQQGTRMPDVPQSVCKRWLDDGIKPFNYFAQENKPVLPPTEKNDDS